MISGLLTLSYNYRAESLRQVSDDSQDAGTGFDTTTTPGYETYAYATQYEASEP